MRVLLSEAEQGLLDLCRPETERVYRHLRQRMDVTSALVGNLQANRVGYGRLAIEVQFVPPQGSTAEAWKPSNRELQCRIDELVRVGLVQRVALPDERGAVNMRQLVLRFLAVDRDYCVQNHEREMSVRPERVAEREGESFEWQGFAGEWASDEREGVLPGERDIFCDSVIREETNARASAEADESSGVNAGAGGGAGRAPAAQSATDVDAGVRGLVQALKGALGPDYRPDAAFIRAANELSQVVQKRAASGAPVVTAGEVRMAVAEARERVSARAALASYAVRMMASGSLLPRPAKVVPLRPAAQPGRGPNVLDEMDEFIKHCEQGGCDVVDGCA
jgi:hypothetical protein